MLIQTSYTFDFGMNVLVGMLMMGILIILNLVVLSKYQYFMLSIIIELFSLIIGGMAITIQEFPLTPYFQIFFIIFQSGIFLIMGIKYRNKEWGAV